MKLILSLIAISSCFADISIKNDSIYQEAWKLFKNGKQSESSEKCLQVLNDPTICNVDRLHFLMSLKIFRNDPKDQEEIQRLIKNESECFNEYLLYYN